MTFSVKINCDNAAFEDQNYEVARILRELADKVENDSVGDKSALRDVNGNKVGEAKFS